MLRTADALAVWMAEMPRLTRPDEAAHELTVD
jgi:hypothetical protein